PGSRRHPSPQQPQQRNPRQTVATLERVTSTAVSSRGRVEVKALGRGDPSDHGKEGGIATSLPPSPSRRRDKPLRATTGWNALRSLPSSSTMSSLKTAFIVAVVSSLLTAGALFLVHRGRAREAARLHGQNNQMRMHVMQRSAEPQAGPTTAPTPG